VGGGGRPERWGRQTIGALGVVTEDA
jgi:hypothetical protein